jgi:hypothetical protein
MIVILNLTIINSNNPGTYAPLLLCDTRPIQWVVKVHDRIQPIVVSKDNKPNPPQRPIYTVHVMYPIQSQSD